MDGQSERTIQVLKDLLSSCVIDFGGYCDRFIFLYMYSCNNRYHSIIDIVPFEELYGRGYRLHIGWFEVGDLKPLGVVLVKDSQYKVRIIKPKLLAA